MKRIFGILLLLAACGTTAVAQNCIVVDSEKVFKSIDAYNKAIEALDQTAQEEQKKVDASFASVEKLYNDYMTVRNNLSQSARQVQEERILAAEKQAQEYQESVFGNEGTLMKQRIAAIQPIQKMVFEAIEAYAKEVGADVVLDAAANPTLLYRSASADRTQAIIDRLKK